MAMLLSPQPPGKLPSTTASCDIAPQSKFWTPKQNLVGSVRGFRDDAASGDR